MFGLKTQSGDGWVVGGGNPHFEPLPFSKFNITAPSVPSVTCASSMEVQFDSYLRNGDDT